MSFLCSDVNWTPSVIGYPVDVGAKVVEELHHGCVALGGCEQAGCGSIDILYVYVSADR